jgi:SEC-C motif-containing protein
MIRTKPAATCPCGLQHTYEACCGRFHAGLPAPTAEALMRSRYSAYVLTLEPYLLSTWHVGTRPASLDLNADQDTRWLGLEVKRHETIGPGEALVEFVARYKIAGRAHRIHETSRFRLEDGRWYYVDGEFPAAKAS